MVVFGSSVLLGVFYFAIFLASAFQITRIIWNKHRLLSYQGAFLLCCAGLGFIRGLFFCLLFEESSLPLLFFILYWTPIVIQFATFSLLVVFYAKQIYRKSWEEFSWKIFFSIYFIANLLFLSYFIAVYYEEENNFDISDLVNDSPLWLSNMGQLFSSSVFIILVIILGYYGVRVFLLISNNEIATPFHLKGAPNILVVVVTFIIVAIYIFRATYDLLTLFGIFSVPVLTTGTFVNELWMFILYFTWEITPASLVILLFWNIPTTANKIKVRELTKNYTSSINNDSPSETTSIKQDLFSNERRYDSDEEENISHAPYGNQPSLYGNFTPYSISTPDRPE